MNDENQLKPNDFNERVKKFEESLESFDKMLKSMNSSFHNVQDDNSGFNIFYIHKQILDAEKDRLILKNSYESLLKSSDKLEERLDKLEESLQELTGGLNQVRMSLSKITSEKQKAQDKFSNIFWSVVIPILVSIIIFVLSLTFRGCTNTVMDDIFGNNKAKSEDYIKL
jgi:prefoldin subunit 5